MSLASPRGTHDILPGEVEQWQFLEAAARRLMPAYGYNEVRLPVFEHTELFKRSVGDTTDIVNKEMYTFTDRSDRSLTLRPEGTAGVVRAYLNGGLNRQSPPVKLWYMGPMFRYEGTQKGRQRQFHQIGIEAFGSSGPLIDAEVLLLGLDYLNQAGIKNFELHINSIGDSVCRPAYREKLRQFLKPKLSELCADCQDRFERNPLRMLDCKSKNCQAHYHEVPASLDNLCEDCQRHWDEFCKLLEAQNIKYVINRRLVRGLDYYNRSVFEVISQDPRLGAQSTILAGGRYDNLVETMGGSPTPAVGWALGLERLQLLAEKALARSPQAFIVSPHPDKALELASLLRQAGISCDLDFPGKGSTPRPFTKQLAHSSKLGARYTVIAGDDELMAGEVTLKDMESGSQQRIPLNKLLSFFSTDQTVSNQAADATRSQRS